MRKFDVLFDEGEAASMIDAAYAPYGPLGFPDPPQVRPWTYANFVQTVDGIVSLLGPDPSGGDIAQSAEDRWLMDLLRAHADGVLLGMNTLKTEQQAARPRPRGPVFRIVEPALQQLRAKLGRGRERNIFVTGTGDFRLADFAAFDGEKVEPFLICTADAEAALRPQLKDYPHLKVIVEGRGVLVDLSRAVQRLREEFGIRYLLCEGGPTLYAAMLRQKLIDEKFITVAPFEAGQQLPKEQVSGAMVYRPTIFAGEGFSKEHLVRWRWLSCRRIENHQFHRYRRIG